MESASYKILLLPELKEITAIISGLISCAIRSSCPGSFVRPVFSRELSRGWRRTPVPSETLVGFPLYCVVHQSQISVHDDIVDT